MQKLAGCMWNAQGLVDCHEIKEGFKAADPPPPLRERGNVTRTMYDGASQLDSRLDANAWTLKERPEQRPRVIKGLEKKSEKAYRDAAYEIDCSGHRCQHHGYL